MLIKKFTSLIHRIINNIKNNYPEFLLINILLK